MMILGSCLYFDNAMMFVAEIALDEDDENATDDDGSCYLWL